MHAPLPKLPAKMPAERSRSRRERRSASARRPVLHVVMPGLEVARATPRKGETVTAFLRRTGWAFRDPKYGWQFRKSLPTVLEVNGEPVLRKQWRHTKIAANDNVRFVSYPRGGQGSTGKQVIGLVALVAVAAFAGPAAGLVSGALFGGSAVATAGLTAAFGLGGALLVNALTAPKPGGTNAPGSKQDQIYSIQAQGNVAKLGQPLPVWYGRLKNYPDLAATPWSEFVGNDQYLNILLSVSMGSMEYEQLLISDTPFWDPENGVAAAFSSAQVWFYEPGQSIDAFPINVAQSDEVNGQQLPHGTGISFYQEPISPGDWIGPFVASPAGEQCYRIAIDYAFPAGCYIVWSDSTTKPANSYLTVQYQAVNDAGAPIGDWQTGYSGIKQFASRAPIRDSIVFDVPPGRYQVRFRREDDVPGTSGTSGNGNWVGASDVIWAGLRGFLQGDNVFPDVSTIAIRIKATESTQGSYKFGCIGTRKLPVWHSDTGQFVLEATRSATWAAFDIGTNGQYGAEIANSKVDFNTFVNHAAGCDARDDTFDYVFTSAVTVPEAVDKALNVARSRHFWLGDTISIVRDEWNGDVPSMLFTDREIVRVSTKIDLNPLTPDDPDAVSMEYVDEDTRTLQQVQYPANTELFTAAKPSPKRLDGIVKRANAYKEAAFYYLVSIYRRESVQIGCEYEGRAITQGQTLRISSELPQNYGQSGAVVSVNDNVLTLNPVPSWDEAGPYFMRLRRPNGKSFGPVSVARGANDNEAVLDADDLTTVEGQQGITLANVLLRADGGEDPSFELGTAANQARCVKVLTGQPNGDTFTLATVIDDERVHATDIGTPPILPTGQFPSNQTLPLIFGLNVAFDQGTAEPMLRASWFPSPGAQYYVADVSYDGGNSWIQVYEGIDNKFTAVVTLAGLTLRVQAVGQLAGPYATVTLGAPTITIADNTVAYQSLQDAIKEQFSAMEARAADDRAAVAKLAQSVQQALARTNIDKRILRTDLVSSNDRANASISQIATVATDAQTAVAELQNTIGAGFDDLIATVDEQSTAIATLNGYAAAQWSVTISVDSLGRKSVAGIRLMADGDDNSVFSINANEFFITFPDAAGGDPVPVFGIGNVDGVPKTTLLGTIFVDGGVITRMVGAGQITGITIQAQTINTLNLAINSVGIDQVIANSMSNTVYDIHGVINVTTPSPGTRQTLWSQTVDIQSGTAVMTYCAQFNTSILSAGASVFEQSDLLDFLIDGVVQNTWTWSTVAIFDGSNFNSKNNAPFMISWKLSGLSPGNHSFAVRWGTATSFGPSGTISAGMFGITDFRR